MAVKHEKYLISVHPKSQKITKVQKVGSAGELTDVEPQKEQTYVPMILGPWPSHKPKKAKKKTTRKKTTGKKTARKKTTRKKTTRRKK